MITRHILTIRASGRRVHYRRCGSGPPLLMVHQSPRSSAEYAELMQRWGEHFTCIAPDTPGFGQSDPLAGEPEIGDFAEGLVEFLGELGIARCPAYGFHSGGIILVATARRHPRLFSALAVGGYAIWTEQEMRVFGERYLPPFEPQPYGEHLTWLWNRMLEQSWFFPWFDLGDATRLPGAHDDPPRVHQAVMEMLDAGDAYRAGYGAVLRAPRDIPPAGSDTPPVLITAYDGDPLQAHIARLGELPPEWEARAVSTPAEHQAQSLAFLQRHSDGAACPELAEDSEEGWLPIDGGLIHWRGEKGGTAALHAPAGEADDPPPGGLALDAPGHGLSSDFADPRAAVEQAAQALGAARVEWPRPPRGDPERLYPDLSPDRFGTHLLRAWGAERAEALFDPWYCADKDHAVPVDPAAIEPSAIARRARARLRAGDAARRWHQTLCDLHSKGTR